jgi:1-aminocyclopropane-1-carboxylate deaminase/D-cysteine desulfhydrase-like pyridoxal-dependent ACC family enzyme
MDLSALPRVTLTRLPTPLEEAPRLAAALGVARLLVKRDDLTDLALGGNKVRKLEFLIGDARAQGADALVTTAGSQSNFLRLTAAAARRVGMTAILVVRGHPDAPSRGNLLLMRLFGADIRFVETDDPFAPATRGVMQDAAEEVRGRGGRAYMMNIATFSGGLATIGYVAGAFELVQQLNERGVDPQHLVLAAGSGGTYAGLLLGLRLAGFGTHVLGASVNIPAPRLRRMIAEHIRDAAARLRTSAPVRDDEIDITDAHVGSGYGVPTSDGLTAIRLAATTEGLIFDPTYTGKAWAALAHEVRGGRIGRDTTVVFLHTGGAPNVFLHADAVAGAAPVAPAI